MQAKRGRKSAGDLSSVVVSPNFGGRLNVPDGFTDRQTEIWNKVVATEPAEFFATAVTQSMLAHYCRHQATADELGEAIDNFDKSHLGYAEGMKRFKMLLQMKGLETRAATGMATKLRLTNQSKYHQEKAATVSDAKVREIAVQKPWGRKRS